MTIESWDVDQALTYGAWDEELEGCYAFDRYGVTGCEEVAGEPFGVALSQEEPELRVITDPDDQWLFFDDDADRTVVPLAGDGPEVGALHVFTP
jgi:hypothetical protein